MNCIPYWLVSYWGFDYDDYGNKDILVIVLKYKEYVKLKEDHEELLMTYRTVNYNKECLLDVEKTTYGYNESEYNLLCPIVEISDELALYLGLIEGKNLFD